MNEYQKADPAHRRIVIGVLLACAAAGVFAILFLQQWLEGITAPGAADPQKALDQVMGALQLVMALMSAGLAALGLYGFRLGGRVIRDSRFPPRDMKVIRDTRLIIGEAARKRGRRMRAAAVLIVLTGLLLPGMCVYVFQNAIYSVGPPAKSGGPPNASEEKFE